MNDVMCNMEEMMQKEFRELTERLPKDMARERRLPDDSTVKEWGLSFTVTP